MHWDFPGRPVPPQGPPPGVERPRPPKPVPATPVETAPQPVEIAPPPPAPAEPPPIVLQPARTPPRIETADSPDGKGNTVLVSEGTLRGTWKGPLNEMFRNSVTETLPPSNPRNLRGGSVTTLEDPDTDWNRNAVSGSANADRWWPGPPSVDNGGYCCSGGYYGGSGYYQPPAVAPPPAPGIQPPYFQPAPDPQYGWQDRPRPGQGQSQSRGHGRGRG